MIIATGWSLSPVIPFAQPARRGLLSEEAGARQSPWLSGNDRGNELIDDFLNLILEQELLLFEPGELQQIARGTLLERGNHAIEIAVLLSEFSKARPKLGFSFSVQGFVSVTLNGEFRVLLSSLQAPD
jgi:hypothetical protein